MCLAGLSSAAAVGSPGSTRHLGRRRLGLLTTSALLPYTAEKHTTTLKPPRLGPPAVRSLTPEDPPRWDAVQNFCMASHLFHFHLRAMRQPMHSSSLWRAVRQPESPAISDPTCTKSIPTTSQGYHFPVHRTEARSRSIPIWADTAEYSGRSYNESLAMSHFPSLH